MNIEDAYIRLIQSCTYTISCDGAQRYKGIAAHIVDTFLQRPRGQHVDDFLHKCEKKLNVADDIQVALIFAEYVQTETERIALHHDDEVTIKIDVL